MHVESTAMKFLKWAGIAALVAVPLLVILKKISSKEEPDRYDERDIFSAELED